MRGIEQIPWLYDAGMALSEWTGLKRWRRELIEGARGATLEIGCGTGRNFRLYGADARPIVGLDPVHESLLAARRRDPAALLVRASAEALPFRDGAFETVVSSLVFCSVPDAPKGLAEVKRVLAPGGALRMLEHVRLEGWRGAWQDWIQPLWTFALGGCHPNRRTESSVEAAGFSIDHSTRRANGPFRRFVARANEK